MQQSVLEDALQNKIKYYGYKGINLDNIKIEQLKNLRLFLMRNLPSKKYDNVQGQVDDLDTLNLDEVKKLAAEFLNKYFTINDVYSITEKELQEKSSFISCVTNAKEAYDNVNSLLIKKSPIDLDIHLVGGHALSGQIVKPLLMIPGYLNESKIASHELGDYTVYYYYDDNYNLVNRTRTNSEAYPKTRYIWNILKDKSPEMLDTSTAISFNLSNLNPYIITPLTKLKVISSEYKNHPPGHCNTPTLSPDARRH